MKIRILTLAALSTLSMCQVTGVYQVPTGGKTPVEIRFSQTIPWPWGKPAVQSVEPMPATSGKASAALLP